MSEVQKFKVGDWVRLTGSHWDLLGEEDLDTSHLHQVEYVDLEGGYIAGGFYVDPRPRHEWSAEVVTRGEWDGYAAEIVDLTPCESTYEDEPLADWEKALLATPVNPRHYEFPGGVQVSQISGWLTANAAQAFQYIARSSRIDGQNKTDDPREDLKKAIRFLEFELERLG